MNLTELLNREISIRPARRNYSLHDVVKAYEFQVNGSLFLCYLDACAGEGRPNTFGFMKIEGDRGSHKVTGEGIPFKVLSGVMQCIRLFIQELYPPTIYISGFSPKQHKLYVKMIQHFHNMIPAPYFVAYRGDAIFISRDEHLSDKEGAVTSEYDPNTAPYNHDDALGGNPERPLRGTLSGFAI